MTQDQGKTRRATQPVSSVFPIIPISHPPISARKRSRCFLLAERLLRSEPALSDSLAFGENVRSGTQDGPLLLIGDHSDIPLLSAEKGDLYQYRMALLARDGDLIALNVPRDHAFETYLRTTLRIGAPDYLEVDGDCDHRIHRLAKRCIDDPKTFTQLANVAAKHGSLTIVPHIGTGYPWLLASAVSRASNQPICVAAPPPRLTRRTNDKVWFAQLVQNILGPQAQPRSFQVFGPAALVGRVASLARQSDRIVVKIPDSAGSAGNISLRSHEVRELSMTDLHRKLLTLLQRIGWTGQFPLQAQIWDFPIAASPSVQLWIPHLDDCPPLIEGIFEQVVHGFESEFVGSLPSQLSSDITSELSEQALQLATVLQRCGYFGRCSFDAVLVGEAHENGVVHWIECNGRWGGVSIPMTLVNRLAHQLTNPSFVVMQRYTRLKRKPRLVNILDRLADQLFIPAAKNEGIVILSPPGDDVRTRLHFAAIGKTPSDALKFAKEAANMLLSG